MTTLCDAPRKPCFFPHAALASCLACGVSYRSLRRTQRAHSKLASRLAEQAHADGTGSKDGTVAAATLSAMAAGAQKSEMQLLSTFCKIKLRSLRDSAGSCCACSGALAAPPGAGLRNGAHRRGGGAGSM